MERLLVRVDADTRIGTGHFMRCLALAQAWKDAGGQVAFITACQNEGLLERLREEGFDLHMVTHPHPSTGDWDYTSDILAAHPDSWVVLDGYHFDEGYQQRVRGSGHLLLVIDDNAHLKHYHADILLNQNLHAEQLHYSCETYTRMLLGPSYVLLRREYLSWKDWRREIPEKARRILITLGGGDPENFTLKVIQALQQTGIPEIEAVAVIGASNPHDSELETAIRQSCIPIRLIRDARNMPELMAWADVAITASGTTCWESAFMGLPALVLILADNQSYIAEWIGKAGLAVNLGWYKNLSASEIIRAAANLIHESKFRAKMAELGCKLVDGSGANKVVKLAQNHTSQGNCHKL